ncbi:MAG: tyrosine--tRNA ligase [Puniceicoccales bacterium]|jgi:tyrosyl-tRNA synthetase|nr:tyrosine--tRNA ligase [Puniceicoccales bacterium]
MEIQGELEQICSNAQHVAGLDDLRRKLARGRPLRIKFGVDPTRPDLTFGHLVVFRKLRQLQDLGHEAIFLIGDFTTTIGDPSGRSETRPVLTAAQIEENSQTYLAQAFRILDPKRTTVRRNGEWFSSMSLADMLSLAREMTVAQLIEREDFDKRLREGVPIAVVEFLYPLIQGYDSVVLEADVELGGSDQLFNMLVGRVLQKNRAMEEQAVLCMPLLVGLDGARKMSKSYGNYIAFNDSAQQMFGKILSIPDAMLESYHRLLLGYGDGEWARAAERHPMEAKKRLASALVAQFHGEEAATHAREEFERVFSRGEVAEERVRIALEGLGDSVDAVELLAASGAFPSRNEIRRLLEQGAVRLDGVRVTPGQKIEVRSATGQVLQVGKRQFFQLG